MDSPAIAVETLLGPLTEAERKNAPERLYAAGEIELFRIGPRVGVIGTRQPSPDGVKRTQAICRALSEGGVVVVSGLAEGIDTTAHRTAISAGGRTIAVLGTPLSVFYPRSNEGLQREMMRDHLVLSQFAPGTASSRSHFPMRNRTMALVSHATVIVEAGEVSGTLYQGWEALRLGRPLFLMESLFKNPRLKWPPEMVAAGARVLTRATLGTLFDSLPRARS